MADRVRDPFGLCGQIVDGRYRIQEVVGQGGFGVVYRAFHLGFDGAVALKLLKLPADADDPSRDALIDAFKREGRILFELCAMHHSIVQVTDTGVVLLEGRGAVPYLALEWLDGAALNVALARRTRAGLNPMTLEQALGLMHPVAEALGAAHSKRISHRDVKPGNIFLTRKGGVIVPKLLDFGIAKVVSEPADTAEMFRATAEGSPFTALYAAPEQWVGRLGATGTWTDVYAFALVMTELLTGQPPGGNGDALRAMGAALDEKQRPTPGALGASVSGVVEQVFLRALNVEPRTRTRTLNEFWSSLCAAAGVPDDSSPRPVRTADWDWPDELESVVGPPPPAPQEIEYKGATLPTEESSGDPASDTPGTGGPVVSRLDARSRSRPVGRAYVIGTALVAAAAVAMAGARWMASRRPGPPLPSPAVSELMETVSATPVVPHAPPAGSAPTTSIETEQKAPPARPASPPPQSRERKPILQVAIPAPPAATSPPPAPSPSEPAEPPAEEILKSRR